jgi:hypothetical protein
LYCHIITVESISSQLLSKEPQIGTKTKESRKGICELASNDGKQQGK